MATLAPDAIHGEFARLAQAGLAIHEYARAAMRVLRRAVAFDAAAAVWFDPTAALPVDKWIDDADLHLAEIELDAAEIDKYRALGASGRRAARLSEPPRLRGVGDELRVVDIGDSGLRGGFVLYRRHGAPRFTARDVNLLASLKGECAETQRMRLEQDLSADGGDIDRGLLVLDDDDGIEMADTAATAWLDELGATGRGLPLVVTSVAERARAIESGRTERRRHRTCASAVRSMAARTRICARQRRQDPSHRGHAGAGAGSGARRGHRRRLRPDRARAARDRARGARAAHRRDRRGAVSVDLHGPGPPQGHLREARRVHPGRARRPAVRRSLTQLGSTDKACLKTWWGSHRPFTSWSFL